MNFYRLGHVPELALAEFNSIATLTNAKYNHKFLISNLNIDLKITGSIVYSGTILSKVNNMDDLAQALYQLYLQKPTKKLGISIVCPFESKNLIKLCHEIGFKKINLIFEREPNAGNFKDIKDWLILFDFYGEVILGKIEYTANQDIFATLDNGLPSGNMKRGKMNLKLALSLLNLSKNQNCNYIWDPFCGQGGLAVIDLFIKQKPIIATDLDRSALKDLRQNLLWLTQKYPKINQNKLFLHSERLDAKNLAKASKESNLLGVARKKDSNFDYTKTAIITEGYLGPTYQNRKLPDLVQIQTNLNEIENLWQNSLLESQILKIPELVICLPAYKYNDIHRIDIDNMIRNTDYTVDEMIPGRKFIDYARSNSVVIHQILRLKLNT